MWCNLPWNTTEPQNHSSLHKCQNKNVPHRERLKHSETPKCLNIDRSWYTALLISRDFYFEGKINQIQQPPWQQQKTNKPPPPKKKNETTENQIKDNHVASHPSELWQKLSCHLQSQWHHSKNKIYRSEATFDIPSPVQASPQVLKLALLNHPKIPWKRASTIHCFLNGYIGIVDTALHNRLQISLGVTWFKFKCG